MKVLGAVFVAFLAVGPLSAQYWSVGGFGNVVFPGLGHAPAGGNPFGNVVSPGVSGNRYGGLVPGFRSSGGTSHRRSNTSGIYAFPVFIGGYGYAQPDQAAPASDGTAAANSPAQPPVVINQYFGAAPADQAPPPDAPASNFHYYQAPANENPTPSDSSYYLIAFKDNTIYSAVAYYTEGDTLHYFTSGNVHNQVSLSLVDRQLTEKLNRDRNVEVRLTQ
jgi:hypothetical protein